MLEKIERTADFLRRTFKIQPKIAVILGSGLGDFTRSLTVLKSISYHDIPGFSTTTIDGHNGNLILAEHKSTHLLILQGRLHFYEGLTMEEITYPIRVLKFLGIELLILSNAAGGMNENFKIGDLMIIKDHINLMPNPLIGIHNNKFGARFPDMSKAYDEELIQKAIRIANAKAIDIQQGVYIGVTGPTYETPAEYKFFRLIGGDAVGMSTVPEVIVANQMRIKCFAVSVITDLGVPGKIEYITHEMVKEAAQNAEPKLANLILSLISDY